ncbi:hypothetical protein FNF31_03880 [Cafeteria roenbergensis]|uniref:Alanine--tRNA ligase n=1 Tax=Cafeteria roenbergensis TaxID=33653 RepID=A0A5A8D9J5_CAFRO|nr:hypothetical protein FNF31_03880 [Cafeteria roenbergensis]
MAAAAAATSRSPVNIADVAKASAVASAAGLEWPVSKVRQDFIDFFVTKKDHKFVKSSPVVPHDDPTLLFANAGMNQFKAIFTGTADPSGPLAGLTRAANSQKCIRAGGKHNDLDDVGRDTYHHTFFEMMGNWSFSDFFKREAIEWAWELLTEVYKMPKDRMYATYFEGDDDVPADIEARDIWLSLGLPENRVIASNKADNFWEMGDTGPCGPCSEIHFDRIGGRDASHLVNMDDPDVIEIWNLVFIQYFRSEDSSLSRLPHNHVDTGMGLERVTGILQDVRSNYDTDIFRPLFASIRAATRCPAQPEGCREYTGKLGKEDTDGVDMAYRVVADHIRTLTFAITDGAVPSSEGRGYVLRRVLRRAVRFGDEKLGAPRGFFSTLVPAVVELFGEAYPELAGKAAFVQEVLADEEPSSPGPVAFFLYDSMGFPVDLTQIMAEERGLTVDVEGFNEAMERQREASRSSRRSGGGVMLKLEAEQTAELAARGVEPTDTDAKYEWYVKPSAVIKAIWAPSTGGFVAEGDSVDASAGPIGVILDKSPFYYESGGQESDTGVIAVAADAAAAAAADADDDIEDGSTGVFDVDGAQAFAGFALHMGTVRSGALTVGSTVRSAVDYQRRELLAPNHTMTHVLNFALRKVLGGTVDQKGSMVAADKLRFDFNSSGALTGEQVKAVEDIVNGVISSALPVYNKVVPLADGRSIETLRAVFGETYPDPVRVVSVGAKVEDLVADPANAEWADLSVEFCGGTHLRNTSAAGRFAIVEEVAVAKGIRRIVAVTKDAATDAFDKGEELLSRFSVARSMPWRRLQDETPALKAALDAWTMPAHVKSALRAELAELEKKVFREKKADLEKVTAAIAADVVAAARAAAEAGAAPVVFRIEGDGADPKAMAAVVKEVTKVFKSGTGYGPTLVWFADADKFAAAAIVPKDSAVAAKAWVEAAIGAADGTVRPAKNGLSAQVAGKAGEDTAALGDRATAFVGAGAAAAAAAATA